MKSMVSETRISDHDKIILNICRFTFAKGKPKTFYCRCSKMFKLEKFQMKLKNKNEMIFPTIHLDFFLKNLKHILINWLPSKRKKLDLMAASS